MGHKTISMAARYSHLAPSEEREAAMKVANNFRDSLEKADKGKQAQSMEEEQAAIA